MLRTLAAGDTKALRQYYPPNASLDIRSQVTRLLEVPATIPFQVTQWDANVNVAVAPDRLRAQVVAPVEVKREGGKVSKVVALKMELGEPDDSGRRRPVPIEGSEYEILDQIIENADIAANEQMPLCQDCGLAVVFIEQGQDAAARHAAQQPVDLTA